jgi:single-strand DNA-binding protein
LLFIPRSNFFFQANLAFHRTSSIPGPYEGERAAHQVIAKKNNHQIKTTAMEIIGRVTKDAFVNVTKTQKQVVNFSVAVNMSYRPRGESEYVQATTYYNCSFWKTPKIAAAIKKGMLVELRGNLSVSAYINAAGEPKADLRFHVDAIKFHSSSKEAPHTGSTQSDTTEDAPF